MGKAGQHKFKIMYFHFDGPSGIIFKYSGPDTGDKMEVVPDSAFRETFKGTSEYEPVDDILGLVKIGKSRADELAEARDAAAKQKAYEEAKARKEAAKKALEEEKKRVEEAKRKAAEEKAEAERVARELEREK